MCKLYSELCDDILGTRGEWRWDQRQEDIAERFIDQGMAVKDFTDRAKRTLYSCKQQGKRPPFSLKFFEQAFKETKKDKSKQTVSDIIKQVSNRSKMK